MGTGGGSSPSTRKPPSHPTDISGFLIDGVGNAALLALGGWFLYKLRPSVRARRVQQNQQAQQPRALTRAQQEQQEALETAQQEASIPVAFLVGKRFAITPPPLAYKPAKRNKSTSSSSASGSEGGIITRASQPPSEASIPDGDEQV
jgi:hypothetical protein